MAAVVMAQMVAEGKGKGLKFFVLSLSRPARLLLSPNPADYWITLLP
jgi:hypothetical protein